MTWFRRSVHPEDELSAYVDGELGERARRAVEAHLASCEACSTLLKELQGTKSLLSELPKSELRRSLTLGPQFAVERRTAAAPRRMSFSFAPAVALSVLVALLLVDAADFSAGGSSSDEAFDAAASTASRQSAPEAGGDLALEATKDDEEPAAAGGAAAAAEDAGGDAGPTADAGEAGGVGGAAGAAPTEEAAEDAGTAASALAPEQPGAESTPAADSALGDAESATEEAPPQELAPSPQPPTEEPETFAIEAADDENDGAAPAGGPEDTHVLGTEDSSGGLSTLRILQIVAAIAFAASLLAVFVPRIAGRRER
jgi:hypothetical protein